MGPFMVIVSHPLPNDDLGADMVGMDAEDALEKASFYVEKLR
jgi:hypothetical protein